MRTDIEWVIAALKDEFDDGNSIEIFYTNSSNSFEKIELVFYFDEALVKILLWNSVSLDIEEGENLYEVIKKRFNTIVNKLNNINNFIK